MVSPKDSMMAVARALSDSGKFPSDMGLILHEADQTSQDADVPLPLFEIILSDIDRVHPNNTDLVGWEVDSNDNRIGRIYRAEYELSVEVNVWTSVDGGYDVDDLGRKTREVLYGHSDYGPGRPLTDSDGNAIDEIFLFRIPSGTRADDTIQTPTLRRWRQEVEIWAYEQFKTSEDYIVDVNYPQPDEDFDDKVTGSSSTLNYIGTVDDSSTADTGSTSLDSSEEDDSDIITTSSSSLSTTETTT